MKKHIKIPCFLLLSLAPISSLGLVGCNSQKEAQNQPKIIGPEELTANLVHFSNVDNTILKGFSYSDIANPSNIVIQNTFTQGLAVFKTNISNINIIDKTFDIELVAYDAQPQELTGILSFYYKDQLIDDAPTTTVHLNISKTPTVSDQFDKVKTIQLGESGFGECTFEHFSIDGAPNLQELLDYNVQFTQAGTNITTELFFVDETNFNLKIKVTSAIQGTIQSNISFKYNNHSLAIAGSNLLTIHLLSPQKIVAPTQTDYVLDASQKDGQLIIPGFNFSSIEKDNLNVSIDTQDNVVLSASIINWLDDQNTFSVQIDATFETFCDFTFTLSFINKSTQEPYDYEGHDFKVTTNSIIPRDMLDIVQVQTSPTNVVSLKGFKQESITELQTLGYNTLVIPNDITEIADEAFAQTPVTSLKNLKFASNGSLLTIGDKAFYDNDCFECDLIIPYSVTSIGSSAFKSCQKFKSLTFENINRPINLEGEAFNQCTGMKGDLRLPSQTTISNAFVFDFSGFDGTLYFPANLIDSGEGLGTSFKEMEHLGKIDISVYTDIPYWMIPGKTHCEFNLTGELAKGPKQVFYNKNLAPSKLEQIQTYFYEHGLDQDFAFVAK